MLDSSLRHSAGYYLKQSSRLEIYANSTIWLVGMATKWLKIEKFILYVNFKTKRTMANLTRQCLQRVWRCCQMDSVVGKGGTKYCTKNHPFVTMR